MVIGAMISLIITTHALRSDYLKRSLFYYIEKQFPVHFIIADSSNYECIVKNKEYISYLKENFSINIRHVVFDANISWQDKLCKTIDYVYTKYIAIAADDDFISLFGMRKAIRFLQKNNDYSFVRGIEYGFTYTSHELIFYILSAHDSSHSLEQEDGMHRLDDIAKTYFSFCYSVYKTKDFKNMLSLACENNLHIKHFEIFWMLFFAFTGKGKSLDVPFYYKEIAHNSTGVSLSKSWLMESDFSSNKNILINLLQKLIINKYKLNKSTSLRLAQDKIDILFTTLFELIFFDENYEYKGFIIKGEKYKTIKKFFSLFYLKNMIKKRYYKYYVRKKIRNQYCRYIDHVYSPYRTEFIFIKKCILNTHLYAFADNLDYLIRI